ncbi:unnamed protein product [Pleuronectes platessa]|uniref:Uncharacterized protein n=1 Tax=Pleuronectes platessa TaxID=8262 RepID=A0A9N7YK62_PLEPL|nr:unnamed protein product [Pleuronectes platessa]
MTHCKVDPPLPAPGGVLDACPRPIFCRRDAFYRTLSSNSLFCTLSSCTPCAPNCTDRALLYIHSTFIRSLLDCQSRLSTHGQTYLSSTRTTSGCSLPAHAIRPNVSSENDCVPSAYRQTPLSSSDSRINTVRYLLRYVNFD